VTCSSHVRSDDRLAEVPYASSVCVLIIARLVVIDLESWFREL
jgi:hypothetical protein